VKKTLFVQETCNGGCTPVGGFPCPYPGCPKGVNMDHWEIRAPASIKWVSQDQDLFDFPEIDVDIYRRVWETLTLETCEVQYLAWKKVRS